MFRCHLNVELYLARVGGTNYLFKHACNGFDRATVQIVLGAQHYDKFRHFQNARYVSASKALGDIFNLRALINKQPIVVRLDVYLNITKPFSSRKDSRTEPHNASGLAQKLQSGLTRVENGLELGTSSMLNIRATLPGTNVQGYGSLGPNSDCGLRKTLNRVLKIARITTTLKCRKKMLLAVYTVLVQKKVSAITYKRFYSTLLAPRPSKICERKKKNFLFLSRNISPTRSFLRQLRVKACSERCIPIFISTFWPSSSQSFLFTACHRAPKNYSLHL